MAILKPALTEEQVKKTGVAQIRQEYNRLARDYTKLIEGQFSYCHKCDQFWSNDAFYQDARYDSGKYPICKRCLIEMACDYNKETKSYVDNREKTKRVFQMMDLPFMDELYKSVMTAANNEQNDNRRQTAYSYMITCVKSLPHYRGLTWSDSIFDESLEDDEPVNENSRLLKTAKKRFGKDYAPSDLIWLENEYQDWIKRYPCENKAQEVLYKNICHTELNIEKKQKSGRDTKDDLKTLQDLMASL